MKNLTKCLYGAVAVAALGVAFASSARAEVYPFKNGSDRWYVAGHAEAGIYMNQYGNPNDYLDGVRGPDALSGNSESLLNVHNSDLQLNQAVLTLGRKMDSRNGWDYGFRTDYMFGTDARFVQSAGLEKEVGRGSGWGTGDYYSALAQLFAEVGYKSVSVKVGKFLSPAGSNSIMSTDRFFYSLPMTYAYLPATLTGASVKWAPACGKTELFAGWASSMNESFDSRDDNTFFAGVGYKFNEKLDAKLVGFAFEQNHFSPVEKDQGYITNFIVNYKPTNKLKYTFEWTYNNFKFGGIVGGGEQRSNVFNNELVYTLNDQWAVGGRVEYAHDYLTAINDSTDTYSAVLGANWSPKAWLVVKPEVRYDFSRRDRPYHDGLDDNQFSFGVSAVVKF